MPTLVAAKAVEGLAQHKATPYLIGGLVLTGLGLMYYFVLRPVLCLTGKVTCKGDKKALDIMKYKGFDPNYYRPLKVTLSAQRAKELADQLYDAAGWLNDDEGRLYSALEQAGSADNLSFIAKMFAIRHGRSLAEHLTEHMGSAAEMQRIKDIIDSH